MMKKILVALLLVSVIGSLAYGLTGNCAQTGERTVAGVCCTNLIGRDSWDDESPIGCGPFGIDVTNIFPTKKDCLR